MSISIDEDNIKLWNDEVECWVTHNSDNYDNFDVRVYYRGQDEPFMEYTYTNLSGAVGRAEIHLLMDHTMTTLPIELPINDEES